MARRPTKGIDLPGAPLGDIPAEMMTPAIRAQIEAAKAQIAAAAATEEAATELKDVAKKEFREKASKVSEKDIRITYPALSKLIKAAIAERDKKDPKEAAEANLRLDEVAERVNVGNEKLTSLLANQQIANKTLGDISKILKEIKDEGALTKKSPVESVLDAIGSSGGGFRTDLRNTKPTPTAKPSALRGIGRAAGGIGGILGGVALDYASDKLIESGHEKLGGAASVGSSALAGAGMGAFFGPWGAAAGGLLGGGIGLYQNWNNLTSGGPSDSIKELQAKSEAAQREQALLGVGSRLGGRGEIKPYSTPTATLSVAKPASQVAQERTEEMIKTSNNTEGRAAAEKYYGKSLSDKEYDALIRATHAEAGAKNSPEEQAMIMASIINRGRSHPGGIIGALEAKNQFQSVTGTKNQPGPSANYIQGPSGSRFNSIESSAAMLDTISRDQKNFTAASTAAYGPGTNIGYRNQMVAAGGTQYGGSVFNTSIPGPISRTTEAAERSGGIDSQQTGRFATGTLAQFNMKDASHIQGLQPDFATKLGSFLSAAQQAGHSIGIASGYRSPERQEQLFREAVKKYGSEEAARKWVAPPGRSNHNRGLASDLSYSSEAAKSWAHQNASKFGLNFRMAHEPWHVEGGGGGGEPDSPAESATQVARAGILSPGRQTAMMERGGNYGGGIGPRPGMGMPGLGMVGGMIGGALGGRSGGLFGALAGGLLQQAMPRSGSYLAQSSAADQMYQRSPRQVMMQSQGESPQGIQRPSETNANPDNIAGNVEPVDAATRFKHLFGIST